MRSWLAPLEPCGLGTPFVEALPSYIARLAAIHQIPPGRLRSEALRAGGVADGARHHATDLIGDRARDLANGLMQLTDLAGLEAMTFAAPMQHLAVERRVRRTRSLCVSCLGRRPLHYPLVWCLSAYTQCTLCNGPMTDHCAACSVDLGPWSSRALACRRCGGSIRSTYGVGDRTTSAGAVELLASALGGALDLARIAAGATALVSTVGSTAALAEQVGLSEFAVRSASSGWSRPTPETVIALARRAGSLGELMAHGTVELRPRRLQRAPATTRLDKDALRLRMHGLLQERSTWTQAEVAERLGVTVLTLTRQLPQDLALVVRGGRLVRQSARADRDRRVADQVRSAYAALHAEGARLSKSAIAARVGRSYLFLDPIARSTYAELQSGSDTAPDALPHRRRSRTA